MSAFVVYNGAGRILRFGIAPDEMIEMQAQAGELVITVPQGVRDDTHYVLDGEAVPRVALPAFNKTSITANGVDAAIVTGLPNPTQVIIRRGTEVQSATVTDGVLEIASEAPGAIVVTLRADAPQYLHTEVTIHAS